MGNHGLVIAHHLIFTAYGWWLPNDPRGSSSHMIRNDLIATLGEIHYGRKRLQPCSSEIQSFYHQAATKLRFELSEFDCIDIKLIGEAFSECIRDCGYTCWGCAIMPDHVHILIRKHRDRAEKIITNLQERSKWKLHDSDRRESLEHPVWGGSGWMVFLDHPDDIRRTVEYVEMNPVKIGRGVQRWDFVEEYNGWPLHEGHSPRSPYVKALRKVGRYP